MLLFYLLEVADITHALSKLTEPAPVPIPKLSVTNMVHSAKKKIRKHRGVDESPLNNDVLNTILLVSELSMHTGFFREHMDFMLPLMHLVYSLGQI